MLALYLMIPVELRVFRWISSAIEVTRRMHKQYPSPWSPVRFYWLLPKPCAMKGHVAQNYLAARTAAALYPEHKRDASQHSCMRRRC